MLSHCNDCFVILGVWLESSHIMFECESGRVRRPIVTLSDKRWSHCCFAIDEQAGISPAAIMCIVVERICFVQSEPTPD